MNTSGINEGLKPSRNAAYEYFLVACCCGRGGEELPGGWWKLLSVEEAL